MPKRYSGNCVITIRLVEEQALQIHGQPATYRCSVYDRVTKDQAGVMVGHPKVLVRAVDSPETYDETARAALAFVQDSPQDCKTFHPSYVPDGSGYHVGRRPELASPPVPCDCMDCSIAGEPTH